MFFLNSVCHEILTDQGKEFEAELLHELLQLLGVVRVRTSGYRPQTKGACEVWRRTLNAMLAKVISENEKDWSEWIPYITLCYNATEHSATGFSPFFIFTGREPLWNIDFLLPNLEQSTETVPQYTAAVVDRLNNANEIVRNNLQTAADSASKWYNVKVQKRHFNEGTPVQIFYPRRILGRSPKWQNFYKTTGTVIKKLNDVTYLVKSNIWKLPKIVHVDKLKEIKHFED